MLISTRGRYALRVLIDLAEYEEDGYTPLKDIAGRQDISQKYMESKKFPQAILCRDAKKRNLCYTYIRVCIESVLLSYTGVFCIHLF